MTKKERKFIGQYLNMVDTTIQICTEHKDESFASFARDEVRRETKKLWDYIAKVG